MKISILWAVFLTATMASIAIYWLLAEKLWQLDALFTIAAIAMGSGAWIVSRHPKKSANAIIVGIGLVVGQWWLLPTLFAFATWHFGGFAP